MSHMSASGVLNFKDSLSGANPANISGDLYCRGKDEENEEESRMMMMKRSHMIKDIKIMAYISSIMNGDHSKTT